MGGAASILFWCAAVCRPQAWSARCSGALSWACLSAATPAGAGGLGALGRAVCRSSRIPSPRVAVPSGGGGAPTRLRGGGGSLLWLPSWGGGSGGGWGGRPPAPPPCRASACHPLSPACPPGVYSCRGVCRAAAGVGRGPVGRQRVSAAGGGGGGEGGGGAPPPWLAPPSSPGRPLKGPLRLRRPERRRSAVGRQRAGRAGACLGRGAPAPRVQRPLRTGYGAAVSSVCLRQLLGLRGRGGGKWGGPSGPLAPPPDGRGGGGHGGPGRGGQPSAGVSHPSPPPLPRAGPSCRPSLGPLVPPAVVARRWPAGGGREG